MTDSIYAHLSVELPPATDPRRYSDQVDPPSTRELMQMIMEDPAGTIPVWQETDEVLATNEWRRDTPEGHNGLLAMRSELYALLGITLNGFAHELDDYRAANPPFGLHRRTLLHPEGTSVKQEEARSSLDWVITATSGSMLEYIGDYLGTARQADHAYAPVIARLDALEARSASWRAEQHAVKKDDSSIELERDELQVHINAGISTAASVNIRLLRHIEAILRHEVPETDATLIADTARKSYRLPLELARLSLASSLSFSPFLETSDALTLLQSGQSYRAGFTVPPTILAKLEGDDAEDPDILGCPANIKIGKRMTTDLWHWTIDIAERAGVWET